ncbi:MAG: hypothetical protein MZV70_22250 [Desulfobacterales bacterium]|nr:hypothetical protein [Desulfobacterales bacterium]
MIASRKGIGKTSVLVQLALDKLAAGQEGHPRFLHHPYQLRHFLVREHLRRARQEAEPREPGRRPRRPGEEPGHHELQPGRRHHRTDPPLAPRHDRGRRLQGRRRHRRRLRLRPGRPRTTSPRSSAFAREMKLEVWYSCTMVGEEPLLDKKNVPVILRELPRQHLRPHRPRAQGRIHPLRGRQGPRAHEPSRTSPSSWTRRPC